MIKILILFLITTTIASAYKREANPFKIVNNIRYSLNMNTLRPNQYLEKSAKNHARYLKINNIIAHVEDSSRRGFTGERSADRAKAAGYKTKFVSENLSAGSGEHTGIKSVEGLMSAIYHRFGFLAFDINEMGYGKEGGIHVYNMGNSKINKLCKRPKKASVREPSIKICNSETPISYNKYKKVRFSLMRSNPKMVIFPKDEQKNIPPAFYEEAPDPLPGYSVSGYPISISFNESYFPSQIQMREFYIRDVRHQKVKLIKHRDGNTIFSKKTDPNGHLSGLEFAIFPEKRLDYNAIYYVRVKYIYRGSVRRKQWSFKTKRIKNLKIIKNEKNIRLRLNRTNNIYFTPKSKTDRGASSFSYRCSSDKIKFERLDMHTLRITNKYQKKLIKCTFKVERKTYSLILK